MLSFAAIQDSWCQALVVPEGLSDDVSMTSNPLSTPQTTTNIPNNTNTTPNNNNNPIAPDSDADSEDNLSEGDCEEVNPARLDDTEREMYEKYKQQEREEREEIERELKAHQLELVRHQEELRLREKELQQTQDLLQQKGSGGGGGVGGGSGGGHHSPGSSGGLSSRPPSGGGGGGVGSGGGGSSGGNGHGLNLNLNSLNSSGGSSHMNGGLGGLGGGPRLSADELRAHMQAAQLAALGQFSSVMSPHLGPQFSPRDLNGLHPLRAAALLPTPHGPFATGGVGAPPPPSLPEKFPRPPSQAPNPPSSQRSSPEPANGDSRSHHWTFEEQFKQLYELSDDPQRKEFLDDLFAFMQKRGSPVNRIPIMAKQTLDLYELFRLVVSKGGLVEVINKKLWREITKGLNLPSSITSAAFTLRTQYMKYLYPYECDKLKLSNPSELQAAIDGNRREGRRSSYGYDLSPGPTLVPSTHPLNGSLINGKVGRGSPGTEQWTNGLCAADFWSRPQGMETWRAASPVLDLSNKNSVSAAAAAAAWAAHNSRVPPHHHPLPPPVLDLKPNPQIDEDDSLPPTPHPQTQPRGTAERDALAMEAAARAMEEATRKMEASHHLPSSGGPGLGEGEGSPPRKRLLTEEDRLMAHAAAMPSAHLKITSRNDGRSEVDGSLVVTMEVNGIMYQGVLFAANHPSRRI